MPSEFPIADMLVFPLARVGGSLRLLREADHLLRRFGQLELLDLAAGSRSESQVRAEADRFLFPISGRVAAHLLDLRAGSPSHGAHASFNLSEDELQGVLVPFGVACALHAESNSRVLVLSTHSDAHPEDRAATVDELQKFTAIQ